MTERIGNFLVQALFILCCLVFAMMFLGTA